MNEKVKFEDFLTYFEEIDLPIVLSEDLVHTFDKHALPLPVKLAESFLHNIDNSIVDEFTEFIPCFKIPTGDEFIGLVYWKGGLLAHEYHLATFQPDGALIDHSVIGGINYINDLIMRSIASISNDLVITIASGIADTQTEKYDPTSSVIKHIEVLPGGTIILIDD